MGSAPSHPFIDFNNASLGKNNNILLPPEAFLPHVARGRYLPNKYVKGLGYPGAYRWPGDFPVEGGGRRRRRRMGGKGGDRGGGGRGMGGGGGVPMIPVQVPVQVPMYYDARGVKGMAAPGIYGGRGRAKVQPQVGVRPQMVPMPGVPGQAGGIPYGYAYPPPPPAAPRHQSTTHLPPPLPHGPPPPQPQHQNQRLTPGIPDIPHGARLARPPSPARHVSPQSRSQPRVQGNEWLEGPNPWLDACTCTTNCRCRKGARVLYRAEGKEGDRREGEIRYVVRDEVGRDCGEHDYGCREEGSDVGREKRGRRKKEGSEKGSEVGKIRREMEGLRRDIERMRASGGIDGVPPGIDPRFEFGTPPGGILHDAPRGLDPRLGLDPFMHRPPRNPRRPPRPRHRVPDVPDAMEFPPEDAFFPPQLPPHRRPTRRPRHPGFNSPAELHPRRVKRNARPPPNYPNVDSPSHRFSAPDEEEEEWMMGSPMGRPNPPIPPPQRHTPPGRGGPGSPDARPDLKHQARVDEDFEDL